MSSVPKFWDWMLEFLGLFSDSLGLCLKLGFGPKTKVFRFFVYLVFGVVFCPS